MLSEILSRLICSQSIICCMFSCPRENCSHTAGFCFPNIPFRSKWVNRKVLYLPIDEAGRKLYRWQKVKIMAVILRQLSSRSRSSFTEYNSCWRISRDRAQLFCDCKIKRRLLFKWRTTKRITLQMIKKRNIIKNEYNYAPATLVSSDLSVMYRSILSQSCDTVPFSIAGKPKLALQGVWYRMY